jgi:hypothetical protein
MRAHEFITEHRLVWRKNPKTGAVSLKWRCETGARAGRTVPQVGDCSKPLDIGAAMRMKKTRRLTSRMQARRTKKAKLKNPGSKLAARLNKSMKRKPKKKRRK